MVVGRPLKKRWLSDEAKDLCVKNIGLVYWYENILIKSRLITTRDEIKSLLFYRLCLAADRFDPSKGTKFSTYAVSSFKTGLQGFYRKREKEFLIFVKSLEVYNIKSPISLSEEQFRSKEFLLEIISNCTPLEQKIILYRVKGLTYRAIGRKINRTHQRVGQILKKIEDRLKRRGDQNGK